MGSHWPIEYMWPNRMMLGIPEALRRDRGYLSSGFLRIRRKAVPVSTVIPHARALVPRVLFHYPSGS